MKYFPHILFLLLVAGVASAAPSVIYQRTIFPEADSTYELGTSTLAWLRATSDEYCLTGDTCITSWPSGSGGGLATTTPWDAGSIARVVDGGTLDSISTSSLASLLSYWTKSGTNLYYTGGNVGIGTTTPDEKLTVSGNALLTGTFPYLSLTPSGWGTTAYIQAGVNQESNASGDYLTTIVPSGKGFAFTQGTLPLAVILPSGNFGIGTTTPGSLLTVAGTTTASCFSDDGGATCISGGGGSVTSVDATVPTGLTVSGSPITTSGTLAFAWDTGYGPVLTASSTNWNTFYDTPSTRITAGDNLTWSGNTLNLDAALTGITSITGAAAGINITTATNGNLTLDPGGSGTLTLNAGSGGVNITTDAGNSDITLDPHGTGDIILSTFTGLLKGTSGAVSTATAGTDYELPLTFTYPLQRSTNTISLAFGTSTSNTWGGTQTFTNPIAISSTTATSTFGGAVQASSLEITGTGTSTVLRGNVIVEGDIDFQGDIGGAGADALIAAAVAAALVSVATATMTLTNKRPQPRTASSTSSATLTPDLSSANVYYRTTQTVGLTIAAPTGTPVIGETIAIYVDSAASQTLTMNATYKAFGAAFPASTTAGKTLMITAQYNGTDWKTLWANAV